MHFYDLLQNRVINPWNEHNRLDTLLKEEYDTGLFNMDIFKEKTLLGLINKNFLTLPCSSTFTKFEEMVEELLPLFKNLQSLLLYCEILLTILTFLEDEIERKEKHLVFNYKAICKKINIILEKTNHELHYRDEYAFIVVKNKFTTEAIENIENEELALELLDYNRVSLKGNIEGKRKVLNLIANHIEPLNKGTIFNGTVYKTLNDDIGCYLNKFNIRHNNTEGKNKQDFLLEMPQEELEIWYDDIYTSFLMLLLAEKELQINAKLKALKEQNKIK